MENVLTEIKSEHDEVRALLKKIDGYERVNWDTVEELYVTLKGHHDAEEEVLFPKVRTLNKKAEELIAHLEEEHDDTEDMILKMIEAHTFDREQFQEVYTDITEHMEDEETELFAKSKKALSTEALEEALDPFEAAKKKAQKKAEKEVKEATK